MTLKDVVFQRTDVSTIRKGYYTRTDQFANKQLKRSLSAQSILNAGNLVSQKIVKRGQLVSIRALNAAIDIRMVGKALMDGEKGQFIKVRNSNSKRIIEGRVVAPGIVHVGL